MKEVRNSKILAFATYDEVRSSYPDSLEKRNLDIELTDDYLELRRLLEPLGLHTMLDDYDRKLRIAHESELEEAYEAGLSEGRKHII